MKNYSVKEWMIEWLNGRKKYLKESTYANYSTAVYNHIIPTLGHISLSDLDRKKLQEAVLWWTENGRHDLSGGLSVKTVKDLLMITKLALRAAVNEGLITNINMDIEFPRTANIKKLQVLSKDDQIKLIQAVYLDLTPKNMGILLCLYTGIRIGELCALQWKDVNMQDKTLTISKTIQRIFVKEESGTTYTKVIITPPKTHSSIRTLPLSSFIFPVLQKLQCSNPNFYLLTGSEHYTEPRTYRSYYNRFLKRNGIKHIKFHGLRHTFATRCIEGGADYKTVSELLGHASVNMTLNLYVHPQMEQKRKCVELVNSCL